MRQPPCRHTGRRIVRTQSALCSHSAPILFQNRPVPGPGARMAAYPWAQDGSCAAEAVLYFTLRVQGRTASCRRSTSPTAAIEYTKTQPRRDETRSGQLHRVSRKKTPSRDLGSRLPVRFHGRMVPSFRRAIPTGYSPAPPEVQGDFDESRWIQGERQGFPR